MASLPWKAPKPLNSMQTSYPGRISSASLLTSYLHGLYEYSLSRKPWWLSGCKGETEAELMGTDDRFKKRAAGPPSLPDPRSGSQGSRFFKQNWLWLCIKPPFPHQKEAALLNRQPGGTREQKENLLLCSTHSFYSTHPLQLPRWFPASMWQETAAWDLAGAGVWVEAHFLLS